MPSRKHNPARRHKSTRASRRINKFGWALKPKYSDLVGAWDPEKSAAENYRTLGLVGDANRRVDIHKHTAVRLQETADAAIDWAELPEAKCAERGAEEAIRAIDGDGQQHLDLVKEDEAKYLDTLAQKYGSDFKKMERDTQMNFWQHTAAHLENRLSRLARYRASLAAEAVKVEKGAEESSRARAAKGKERGDLKK
jgi:hypothetical protein